MIKNFIFKALILCTLRALVCSVPLNRVCQSLKINLDRKVEKRTEGKESLNQNRAAWTLTSNDKQLVKNRKVAV